ncbi:MAG: hypothetical protein HYZ27_03320, partial [Deltaproteobacteria bacterium]|nr:hypothetical protein [Deltaproteobacteria bacterium]
CGAGEYCNPFGTCQPRPPCLGNQDCEPGYICNSSDLSGGKCIPDSECGSSSHCDFNSYCDTSAAPPLCVPGCRSTGDCQLGYICSAGNCVQASTGTDCSLCPLSPDTDASYCDYGEICTSAGNCVAHLRYSSLCDACGSNTDCATGMQCLIDDEVAGGNYCAPDCQTNADCPSGYPGCGSLIVIFYECTTTACPNSAPCLQSSEQNRKFCGCNDQTHCNPCSRFCAMSGAPCTSDANCGFPDFCTGICPSAIEECRSNADCPGFGNSCESFCTETSGNCNTSADCPGGADDFCFKYCTDSVLQCTSPSQCPVVYPCEDGVCVLDVNSCGKDAGVTCQELTDPSSVPPCRAE